jgi:pimeloyl-ACP methyl ester carboxylesterase
MHYTDTGSGTGSGSETLVFSHGLLFNGEMFEAQVAHFKDRYRCITFDHRGQGRSEIADTGYDMDTLTEDAAALITELDIGPCHFVGLSMGGFVGMRLALKHKKLLKSLTLLETSAEPEPNAAKYKLLNFIARWIGLWAVADKVMPIMFGQSFLNDPSRKDVMARWRKAIVANHRIGITRAVNGVIYRDSVLARLNQIETPTLIVVGDEDVATLPEKSESMHAAIAGSTLVRIPRAGHSSTIEEPTAVNAAINTLITAT